MGHHGERIAQRPRIAGHLEHDVVALHHAELAHHVAQIALPRVDGDRRAHPHRELAAERVGLGDDHVARPRMTDDGRRHQPDRPGARDEDVLAEDRERRARCAPRCRTGRRSRPPPRRCPGRGARCWSPAAPRTRRRLRRARPRDRSCGRTGGAGPPGSGGTGRTRRDPRRRPDRRGGSRTRCCRPRRSRRRTRGRRRAAAGSCFAAQASHDSMCRSVPQMPVLRTRTTTSLIPGSRDRARSRG